MPTGNTGTNTAKSLRTLTAVATVTHFFEKDKTLLPKVYHQGILPVRVVNDIYCEWVRSAVAEAKAELEATYDNYAKEWKALKRTKANLSEQELMYRRNEPLIAQLRDAWDTRVSKTRFFYKRYIAENEKLKETEKVLDAMFSPGERYDIMTDSQDWTMWTVRDEILGQIKKADQELTGMPIKFNSVQGEAQIKISEVDNLCL